MLALLLYITLTAGVIYCIFYAQQVIDYCNYLIECAQLRTIPVKQITGKGERILDRLLALIIIAIILNCLNNLKTLQQHEPVKTVHTKAAAKN